jgi:hypothetical protein
MRTTGTGIATKQSSQSTRTLTTAVSTKQTGVCVKVEAMSPQNGAIDEIIVRPPLSVDARKLTTGQAGVSFPAEVLNPNITIVFSGLARLFYVGIPSGNLSNVQKISVDLLNSEKKVIATLISADKSPQIEIKLDADNIIQILIKVLATSDGKSPKNVLISVIGCFSKGRGYKSKTRITCVRNLSVHTILCIESSLRGNKERSYFHHRLTKDLL